MNSLEIWLDPFKLQEEGTMEILALKKRDNRYQSSNPLTFLIKRKGLVWDHDNRKFSKAEKAFYWFKTLICLLFRIYKDDHNYEEIAMIAYDYHSGSWEFGGTDWSEIAVGEGIFRNWYYVWYINGTH
jgi:hypothetical protein